MNKNITLPIDAHLPEIMQMITGNTFTLIKASPGSGKTTRVPPELLRVTGKKILILEPRRLAAKMQARRIAEEIACEVGDTVGYLFKGERALKDSTQLLFITEGTLLRFLEKDPLLLDYSYVILDEFHERHLETDLAFYHLQKINQKRKRENLPPLHLVFMSATLNTRLLQEKLGSLSEFNVEIPPFKNDIHYLPNTPSILNAPLTLKIKNVISTLPLIASNGILIFVPGKREIEEVLESLRNDQNIISHYELAPLHGELSKEEQNFALQSPKNGKKKIVVSTNIAESSLTIPYVNIVIDSGLEREFQGNVVTGFGKLITKKIDRASADQRAGRANRTGPGVVYRLYSQLDYEQRDAFKVPALLRAPLMEPIISILKNHDIFEKDFFLESPPNYNLEMGFKQLSFLNLLNASGSLSENGRCVDQSLGLRLSLIAKAFGSTEGIKISDLLYYLRHFLDPETRKDFERTLNSQKKDPNALKKISDLDELILHGFLDLVGVISAEKKVVLQNGEHFNLHPSVEDNIGTLKAGNLIIVQSMGPKEEISSLIPIEPVSILAFKNFLTEEVVSGVTQTGKKKITTKTKLGLITLQETHHYEEHSVDEQNQQIKNILQSLTRNFLNGSDSIRFQFYQKFYSENEITLFDPNLLIDVTFLEWCELERIEEFHHHEFLKELKSELLTYLNANKASEFDQLFPKKMRFTDRRETDLHYEIHGDEYMVFVESFMQDFYGLSDGPKIAEGQLPLIFRLLGPHKRALQTTKDLKSFWTNTYQGMHKELSREYPRHHWPENPEKAPPVLLKRMLAPKEN